MPMGSKGLSRRLPRLLALLTVGGGRWLALLATAYFSLFHWMRSEYLVFSHVWQYGLPFLDPRVFAALLWALQYWTFLVLVALPIARWLSARLPAHGLAWWLAAVGLSIGLGTRGVVGPLIVRAVTAQPVRILPGGGEAFPSPLVETSQARWIVALAEAWWLVPLLVVLLSRLRGTAGGALLRGWPLPALLGLYALVQAPDAPYLLTAGGPRGATTNLQLLAFQLAFGAQEFGYASVLTVLMAGAALPIGGWILWKLRSPACRSTGDRPTHEPAHRGPHWPWALLPLVSLGLLVLARARNPPEVVGEAQLTGWILASALTALLAAGWAVPIARCLLDWLQERSTSLGRLALGLLPVVFAPLVWVLPAVRVVGDQQGWPDALAAPVALVVAAPYLYLCVAVLALGRHTGLSQKRVILAAGAAVAWGTWTDLTVPLMLTQQAQNARHLPSAMVWSLSSHLWRSPLSVPGWPAAWLGGVLLALAGLLILHERPPQTETAGVGDESIDSAQPSHPS